MKFFIVCFIIGSLIAEGLSAPVENAEETNVQHQVNERTATAENENVDATRFRKSTYGAAGRPAYGQPISHTYQSPAPTVPCGKNLLFSCQPSVAPVPCYAPPPSYAAPAYAAPTYAGAYSEPVAQWAYPYPTINQLW